MLTKFPLVWKTLILILSVAVGWGVWMGVGILLFKSNISPLQTLSLWISHFSIVGWLLWFSLSGFTYYFISSKLFTPKH